MLLCSSTTTSSPSIVVRAFVGPRPVWSEKRRTTAREIAALTGPRPCASMEPTCEEVGMMPRFSLPSEAKTRKGPERRTLDEPGGAFVDLYWLPLGAGGRFVRLNGRAYEAVMARIERRPACDLYHSALQVEVPEARFVIEQAPVADLSGEQRGVVAAGAVGSRWASRFRIFRYEIRLWRNGHIPDVIEAVESPRQLASDEHRARGVLDVVAKVPTPVWGREELGTGEMWNSNSVIAWVLARSGIHAESIRPPVGGRAPRCKPGLEVAPRQAPETQSAAVHGVTGGSARS